MDSSRFPGKVLAQVVGQPVLAYLIARCRQVPELEKHLIVATTTREADDPIAEFCRAHNVLIFRGAVEDVAGRLLTCAQEHQLTYFFRLNGDSPVVDTKLLARGMDLVESVPYDFVTNLYPRSYPYGVSVELIRTEMFESAYAQMNQPAHFEHVTLHLYQYLANWWYCNLHQEQDQQSVRLTIDTAEDLLWFTRVVTMLGSRWATADLPEILELLLRRQ